MATSRHIWTLGFVLFSLLAFGDGRRDSVYKSLDKALESPLAVKVLDLRGQDITELPSEIGDMKNLEVLLLSNRLRNLWTYPKSWKYELGFKHKPAGGYAHLHGRGAGKYFYSNKHLGALPKELGQLKKLRLVDVRYTEIYGQEAKELSDRLKVNSPNVLVLHLGWDSWEEYCADHDTAKSILADYKMK